MHLDSFAGLTSNELKPFSTICKDAQYALVITKLV